MSQHERRRRFDRGRDRDGRPQSGLVQPLGRIQRRHQGLSRKAKACLYQALTTRSAKDKNSGRRNMSGSAAAVLTKSAFRKIEWLARDIAVERRPDGVIILKSRIPLQPYEKHIPASLAKWAKQAPERTWLAQRGGTDRQWRKVSYGEAKHIVDGLTQGLLNLGLADRPVAILS